MAKQLLDYVTRRAGDYFRGIATYDGRTVTLQATREDLDTEAMQDRAEEIRDAVRPRRMYNATDELGALRANVQIRDHAVILHFPIDEDRGYLVGLEPEAARDLNEFITECRKIVEERLSFDD